MILSYDSNGVSIVSCTYTSYTVESNIIVYVVLICPYTLTFFIKAKKYRICDISQIGRYRGVFERESPLITGAIRVGTC